MKSQTRMMPPTYFAIAIAIMICLHFILPEAQLVYGGWRLLGILIIAIGFAIPFSAKVMFGRKGTPMKPFSQATELVQNGPYRWTRNPMYLGLVIMLTGFGICLGTLLPFIIIPPFIVLIDRRVIVVEEKMLREIFGEAYDNYCKQVRRWI